MKELESQLHLIKESKCFQISNCSLKKLLFLLIEFMFNDLEEKLR